MYQHEPEPPAAALLLPAAAKATGLRLDQSHASFTDRSTQLTLELHQAALCACETVALAVQGPVLSMFVCACRDCQRATGTGHASGVLVPAEAVTITGATRSFERPTESGGRFTRHFCPDCATTLYAQSSRANSIYILPAGLFAGANDWFAPNQVIFARSAQPWDHLPPDLPRHDTYRPNTEAARK